MVGTAKIIDERPVITNNETVIWPMAKPVKKRTPILNEKHAPTPARAKTAGPGVIIRKNTATMKDVINIEPHVQIRMPVKSFTGISP